MALLRHNPEVVVTNTVIEDDARSYVVGILRIESDAVLVGVPPRISGVVKKTEVTFLRNHLEQAFEVVEAYATAGILVELLMHAGTVELPAELEFMLIHLPAQAVVNLTVGIDAAARIARSGANLSEKSRRPGWGRGEKNDGQSRGVAVCGAGRNIAEPNGARIKIGILWEKALRKSVPAVPQFVHLGRRENAD